MKQILIATRENTDTGSMYKITPEIVKKVKVAAKGYSVVKADIEDGDLDKKASGSEIIIASPNFPFSEKNTVNLKWLHLTSAGANTLPQFIKDSDISVTSSSGVHPVPIAEHVLLFMLAFARGFDKLYKTQILRKKWIKNYDILGVFELYGKKVLIVGMGKIGGRIGVVCKSLGMEVAGVVRDLKKKRSVDFPVFGIDSLKKQVGGYDFVVNCLPGTEHTQGLFDLKLFKKFKKGGIFINIGRGTTVVEKDLIKALKTGFIAGAGLDVFEEEPLPDSSPLWNMENVLITPHTSGWTPQYFGRVIDIFLINFDKYLNGENLPNEVNKKLGY
jgi:D-2-hydroxyacid dehydrogenase (NADP+)